MTKNYEIVIYDGICILCNYFIQFILKKDKKAHFKVTNLQSDFTKTKYPEILNVDSVAVILENGKIGLEQTGFTLTNNRTQCSNFRDEELISSVYLPEMQNLICRLTGAKAAYHYGFLVRTEKPIQYF